MDDTTFKDILNLLDLYLDNELRLRDYLKKKPLDGDLDKLSVWNEGKENYISATSTVRVNLEYSLTENLYLVEKFKQVLFERKAANDVNKGETADFINLVYNDLDKRCDDILVNYVPVQELNKEHIVVKEEVTTAEDDVTRLEKEINNIVDFKLYADALNELIKYNNGIDVNKSLEDINDNVKLERISFLSKLDFLSFDELTKLYDLFLELNNVSTDSSMSEKQLFVYQDAIHLVESYLIELYHDEYGQKYKDLIDSDLLTRVNYENRNGFMSYFGLDYYELTGKEKKEEKKSKKEKVSKKEIDDVLLKDKVHELDIVIGHLEDQLDKLKSIRNSLR